MNFEWAFDLEGNIISVSMFWFWKLYCGFLEVYPFFFLLKCLFYMGVQLINNVLVSMYSYVVIHIYVSIIFQVSFPI